MYEVFNFFKITRFLMAGLLNARFACYVHVNFESAFHPAWQKQSRLPFFSRHTQFLPGLKEGISNGT
jgi:hypothetical protein